MPTFQKKKKKNFLTQKEYTYLHEYKDFFLRLFENNFKSTKYLVSSYEIINMKSFFFFSRDKQISKINLTPRV